MPPAAKTCVICNAPLPFHLALTGNLCADVRCQWKWASIPAHQKCAGCGRPLSPWEFGIGFCAGSAECQLALHDARERERSNRMRERREALRQEARQLRDQAADAVGVREPESYPLALIPSFTTPVTDLPDERRQQMRERLLALIGEAMEPAEPPAEGAAAAPIPLPVLSQAVQTVLGRACGHCQGKCCRTGRDHAYLTVPVLRRYRQAHPEQGPEEVLEAYIGRIGSKTYEGSCVFHEPGGCSLPREMRSDTCNRYFCPDLDDLRAVLSSDTPARAFVASVHDETTDVIAPIYGDRITSAAFLDVDEARLVVPPSSDS
jgi:hypothetical protein